MIHGCIPPLNVSSQHASLSRGKRLPTCIIVITTFVPRTERRSTNSPQGVPIPEVDNPIVLELFRLVVVHDDCLRATLQFCKGRFSIGPVKEERAFPFRGLLPRIPSD